MRGCEVGGHLLATSEIHLVGCLPGEGCMGNHGVVLLDVECDQFLKDSAAAREDLQHLCVRICGTLNIIEVLAGW